MVVPHNTLNIGNQLELVHMGPWDQSGEWPSHKQPRMFSIKIKLLQILNIANTHILVNLVNTHILVDMANNTQIIVEKVKKHFISIGAILVQ